MSLPEPEVRFTNSYTMWFMVALSVICALILSLLASALAKPQEVAQDLDRSKQMMIAAKMLDHQGHFLLPAPAPASEDSESGYEFARYADGKLVPGSESDFATNQQLLDIYRAFLIPRLVDSKGQITTFEAAKIDYNDYIRDFKKVGYYRQAGKLFYEILPSSGATEGEGAGADKGGSAGGGDSEKKAIGYVIPVNGFGLWDAIYGYIAIKPDGKTVIGVSWYDQKETPGLGANIAEEAWQAHFPGKLIFQPSGDNSLDMKSAPVGIVVVRGRVSDVLGSAPKARSAVDGMAGATLTGNGVTDAYRLVLEQYRPFFLKLNKEP